MSSGCQRARSLRCAVTAMLLLAMQTSWADRAVVIGVGQYANPDLHLPGIERDVANAKAIVKRFGVAPDQMHVLENSAATAARIEREIEWALAAGASERAFIYFSGHGTHLKDTDGSDHGALVAHDFQPIGDGQAQGAVLGSWIGQALGRASAGSALLMVDACESGTITKGMRLSSRLWSHKPVVDKYVPTPGAGSALRGTRLLEAPKAIGSARWIAMSAVQADQFAPASKVGSPFTLALQMALTSLQGDAVTPKALRDAAADTLQRADIPVDTTPTGVNPQVWASEPGLIDAPLKIQSTPRAGGNLWSRLTQLAANSQPGSVKLSGVADRYPVKSEMKLQLDLKSGGYLTLINVDRDGNAGILIPNSALPEAKLNAGHYILPTDLEKGTTKRFPFRAGEPMGGVLVVALVTPQKLELPPASARQTGMFLPLDANLMKLIEEQTARQTCQDCRQFTAVVQDAESPGAMVTRPQAMAVETEITAGP